MRTLAIIGCVLSVLWTGAAGGGQDVPSPASSGPDEHLIYSALIEQHYGRSVHRPVVIGSSTVGGGDRFVIDDSFSGMLAGALAPISHETISSYRTLSARVSILDVPLETSVPWRTVSQAALDTTFSQCPRGWDILSERFPGCHGYITLSNVGRNPAGDEALVYTEDHCGVMCGEGTFVYLRKSEEGWRVEKKLTLWVE